MAGLSPGPIVRPAVAGDMAAAAALYAHHVIHGSGTFEETPPDADQMLARMRAVTARGLPYVVVETGGALGALAYAGPFRLRPAYRHTVEDSVYVRHDLHGQGPGRLALGAVITACEAMGLRQMTALIGDSGNAASIGLHRSLGFVQHAVLPGLGFKAGRWLDVVWMQRSLNGGDADIPAHPGLDLSGA